MNQLADPTEHEKLTCVDHLAGGPRHAEFRFKN
jgi:hypothetical protein